MKSRTWHGAVLYLAIVGATSTLVSLRSHASEQLVSTPAVTTSPPSSSKTSAKPTTSATPSQAATKRKVQTFTGDTVQTRYGPVQVSVTFTGKTITAVQTLQTPSGDGRSTQIAARAVPTLHDEVIASQSAKIDTVSGATYTSDGYTQSVQSAIDQLGG